ncbi:MAG: hypothetical protein QXN55_00980 [Candidatus Nitrosotenuis sp.]
MEILEESRDVYDITVAENHNFYANGILIHNCEITLPTTPISHIDDEDDGEIALCILSSLNVGLIKSHELENICDLSVRALDSLIDYQDYPIKAAEKTKNRRSLGIGFTGLAHYLAKLKLNYEDPGAAIAVHKLAESMQYYLLKASNQLAKEKGPCKYFGRTKYAKGILPIDTYKKDIDALLTAEHPWNDYVETCTLKHNWEELRANIKEHGLRNSALSAQAPVESSSLVTNSTNGVEPPRALLSVKKSKKGVIKQIVPQYERLKNNYTLLWDMKSNKGYINIIGAMQKFFDQAISANWAYNPMNYPDHEIPLQEVVKDFLHSYKAGWKTCYYLNTYDMKSDDSISDPHLNKLAEDKSLESLIGSPRQPIEYDMAANEEEHCESCTI